MKRPVDEHISKGTKHCFMKIAAAERLAKGLYKDFVENIIRSIGDALELVLYDCGDVPWSPNTVWEMMVVHPIAEFGGVEDMLPNTANLNYSSSWPRSRQRLNSRRS